MSINASNGYVGIGRNPASYKLDVNGTIRVESTVYTSDIRLKTDIKPMDSCLLRIKSLKPISYFMSEGSEQSSNGYIAPTGTSSAQKANDLKPSDADSVSSFDPEVYAEKMQKLTEQRNQKRRYGFSAQDMQQVFPDLVYEDVDGYLGIDYVALVPMLVEAIQEQQNQIESLRSEVDLLKNTGSADARTADATNQPSIRPTLEQNSPNPFSENTRINYYLPQETRSAILYIYDMNGNQLKRIQVGQNGTGSIIIRSNELKAGMYLYSLIADGKLVGTNKMILTEE